MIKGICKGAHAFFDAIVMLIDRARIIEPVFLKSKLLVILVKN